MCGAGRMARCSSVYGRGVFPQIFEGHQWLSHDVLARAAQMYRDERNANIDPLWLYDINVARELLKQDEKENPTVQIRTTDGNS